MDRRLPHDRISALIVAGLPEFYTELSPTDREILLHALRYYHNPEELPTAAPPASYPLMEWMREADAVASEREFSSKKLQGSAPTPPPSSTSSPAAQPINVWWRFQPKR